MALTEKLAAVADAIRARTGGTALLTLAEMPGQIAAISGGELAPLAVPAGPGNIQAGFQAYGSTGAVITGTAKTYDEGYLMGYDIGYGEGQAAARPLSYTWDEENLTLTIIEEA